MPRESPTAPWEIGAVRLRRVRGPRADGLVYWRATRRAEDSSEALVWSGWGRRQDPAIVAEVLELAGEPEVERVGTVRTLLGEWRAEQVTRKDAGEITARSLANYAQAGRYLSRGLGPILLEQLSTALIRDYARARAAGTVILDAEATTRRWTASPQTIHMELTALRAAWTWGRQRGLAPDRALELPDHRATPTREKYTPTAEELGKVLDNLMPEWAYHAARLLAATGARIGEIARVRWRDVDFERRVIRVQAGDGRKTGQRLVPIGSVALEVLRELGARAQEPDAWVLGTPPGNTENLGAKLNDACAAAGVPRWTPHALRRLAVDQLYAAGRDVGQVAAILGQSPEVALRHYRQARPEELREAIEAAGLGEIPTGNVVRFRRKARKG